jgi:hypothetical protein
MPISSQLLAAGRRACLVWGTPQAKAGRNSKCSPGEVDEVRCGEVRVELLARDPVLLEGEEAGALHVLVKVVVDVAVLLLGRLDQSLERRLQFLALAGAARMKAITVSSSRLPSVGVGTGSPRTRRGRRWLYQRGWGI